MKRAVLVAGGQGRRLEMGVPKAMVTLGGKTLLQHAWEKVIFCDDIVVAAPESVQLPLPERARRIFDRSPGGGPLAGVVAALEDGGFDVAVVLGIDFPFIHAGLLVSMTRLVARLPIVGAMVPAPGGRLQPLAAVYGKRFASEMGAAFDAGERSIVSAVERLGPRVLTDEELRRQPGGVEAFFNLNTLDDLREAERRHAASVKT